MAKGQFKDCGDPPIDYIITMNVLYLVPVQRRLVKRYNELLSLDQMKVT